MNQRFVQAILVSALTALLLAGCGNKAPLYLPEPPAEQQSEEASAR